MDIIRIVLSGTLRPVMEIPRIKMRFKIAKHSPAANRMICALDMMMFISLIVSCCQLHDLCCRRGCVFSQYLFDRCLHRCCCRIPYNHNDVLALFVKFWHFAIVTYR